MFAVVAAGSVFAAHHPAKLVKQPTKQAPQSTKQTAKQPTKQVAKQQISKKQQQPVKVYKCNLKLAQERANR